MMKAGAALNKLEDKQLFQDMAGGGTLFTAGLGSLMMPLFFKNVLTSKTQDHNSRSIQQLL